MTSQGSSQSALELFSTPSGKLSARFEGESLYSSYDPSKAPCRLAGTIEASQDILYIVFSPLLFYGVDVLEAAHISLFFVETLPGTSSLYAKQTRKVYDISSGDINEALEALDIEIDSIRAREVRPLFLSQARVIESALCSMFLGEAQRRLQSYWSSQLTEAVFTPLWAHNIIKNIPFIATSQYSLQRPPEGSSAVVVGAGPTLDRSIPWIKEHRDSLSIICVDTALQTLMESDITPDLVLALDAQFANFCHLPISDAANKVPILTDITASPLIWQKGMAFPMASSLTGLFFEKARAALSPLVIPPLGSVGVAALYLSITLGFEYIYVTGLDLSQPLYQPYAEGTLKVRLQQQSSERLRPYYDLPSEELFPSGRDKWFTTPVMRRYSALTEQILSSDLGRETKISFLLQGGEAFSAGRVLPFEQWPTFTRRTAKGRKALVRTRSDASISLTRDAARTFLKDQLKALRASTDGNGFGEKSPYVLWHSAYNSPAYAIEAAITAMRHSLAELL